MMKRHTRAAVAAALWATAATLAYAGGLSVTPVRLHFGERDRAVALRLSNGSSETLTLLADVQAWSQDAQGRDQLQPSDDLVVSPPVLRLAPRGEQVVRLVLAAPRDPARQMTYRLFLREQPRAAQEPGTRGALVPPVPGVPIALALSLPVFITPAHARHALRCELGEPAQSGPVAQCENTGLAHALLGELELTDGTRRPVARHEGGVYLLPGARRSIPLAAQSWPDDAAPAQPSAEAGWALRARLDRNETLQWLQPGSRQAAR